MKKLDLNNPDTIEKLQKSFNAVMDKRLYEARRNYLLNTFENIGVNRLATLFESVSDKLIESKEGRTLISRYVKTINENGSLKKIYQFRKAIMNPITENADAYLDEALSISENIDKKQYNEGKEKISQILRESVNLAELSADQILESTSDENRIQTAAEYLVTNKKTFGSLSEYVSNKEIVRKYINENKKSAPVVSEEESLTTSELIDKLNENLSSLNEWQKEAISKLTENRLSKKEDKDLFENYKRECLECMDEKIENSDDAGETSKLTLMKEQLTAKEYNEGSFMTDLLNLAELKQTLSE